MRKRSRGTWHRVDAGADGGATFQVVVEQGRAIGGLSGDLRARPGDELELLKNLDTFAYVSIDGVGLAVVDVNAFYGENVTQDFGDPNIASQVLSFYPGYSAALELCDPSAVQVDRTPLDVEVLVDVDKDHPLTIPTLIHRHGLGVMKATSLNAPHDLQPLSEECAAINNTAVMGGMAVLQAYPIDLDSDGEVEAQEVRDYVVVTNASVGNGGEATGWVMVFDLTDRAQPMLVGKIEMPGPVSTIAADQANRRLFVAALGEGLHVVNFDTAPSLEAIDADGDGQDDRVVETIKIADESVTELALAPELGLVFAGGQNVGLASVAEQPPELAVVAVENGSPRAVGRVAPFGVPTAAEGNGGDLPGLVRIEARLPGGLVDAGGLRLDLASEGPGGLEIDGAGDPELIADLPPTSYRDGQGVVLRRLSDHLYESGYSIFVSEPILLVADLRASAYYDLTSQEKAICQRCDLVDAKVYTDSELSAGTDFHPELLSGHRLAVRFQQAFRTANGELYASVGLDGAELEVDSVPWDLSRAVQQEPPLNPSYGTGDVVPGTLLHSGEFSMAATDLALRGRGFDFAFTRTYRSQIVSAGPLGPGWDHVHRMRLRELPDGDVEYFDGRGRRELFKSKLQETGIYDSPPGVFMALNRNEAGWNLMDAADNSYRFDGFGRLVSISDAVRTSPQVGTALEFSYDLRSRLTRVEAHGRWIHFEYDDMGRLIKVGDFSGRVFEYRYDVDGRLEEMHEDPEDVPTLVDLTETGLPVSISKGGIEIGREFNEFGQVTAVVNGNGNRTEYEYFEANPKKGLLKRVMVDPEGLALATSYEYNERGNMVEVTNPRGVRHQFVYNALDWLIEEKWAVLTSSGDLEPIGHRVRYSYDRNGNASQVERLFGESSNTWTRTQADYGLLNEVTETRQEVTPGAADWVLESFFYDENLNLVEHQGPDGQLTRFAYDERNQPETRSREVASGNPGNLQESFVYNSVGQPELRTDANGGVWRISYDGYDRPREMINPLGHKTEVAYDKNGNPVSSKVFGAEGQLLSKSEQGYDALRRPDVETRWLWQYEPLEPGEQPSAEPPADAVGVVRRTFYDHASNVYAVRDPLDRITHLAYDDAERLIRIEDPAGNVTDLDLDAAGNPWRHVLTEQSPGGAVPVSTTSSFDAFDRLTSLTDALGNTTSSYFDLRGNLIRLVDAEGHYTSYAYDGLDRRTRETRPEGIEVSYTYDASSRLVGYRDALGNMTAWSYDVLDRQDSATYADGTLESYEYDRAGNRTKITRANGTVITQGFDGADRLVIREIAPSAAGELVGPTAETFGYDGLDRTISAQSSVLTQRAYDSLSRLLSEKTDSRTLGYGYDAAGSLVGLSYPSGRELTLTPDALSRPQGIAWLTGGESVAKATYGYRGADLVARREVGESIVGTFNYDAARRLEEKHYVDFFDTTVFGERTAWTPRGLKASQSRSDLNAKSMHFAYDGAGRLVDAEHTVDLEVPPAGVPQSLGSIGGVPGQFAFTYDAAQNLTSKSTELVCEDTAIQLPLDGSGRNRPAQVGNLPLTWDPNGNLASKDGLTFLYDYRDRLTEVRNGPTLVAAYTYDAFNRRVERAVAGVTEETVWSDWQPIETYRDGQLHSRRTYGLGLDEIVSVEHDLDDDGTLDDEYLPFYDDTGNLVLVTDVDGRPIERYFFSPYGEQWIHVDSTSPTIEQVRIKDGQIWVEMSEEIQLEALKKAIEEETLYLTNLSRAEDVKIRVTQPVTSGRQARRRFVLDATLDGELSWPTANGFVAWNTDGESRRSFPSRPSLDDRVGLRLPELGHPVEYVTSE